MPTTLEIGSSNNRDPTRSTASVTAPSSNYCDPAHCVTAPVPYKTAGGEERTVSRRALYNAFKAHDAELAETA